MPLTIAAAADGSALSARHILDALSALEVGAISVSEFEALCNNSRALCAVIRASFAAGRFATTSAIALLKSSDLDSLCFDPPSPPLASFAYHRATCAAQPLARIVHNAKQAEVVLEWTSAFAVNAIHQAHLQYAVVRSIPACQSRLNRRKLAPLCEMRSAVVSDIMDELSVCDDSALADILGRVDNDGEDEAVVKHISDEEAVKRYEWVQCCEEFAKHAAFLAGEEEWDVLMASFCSKKVLRMLGVRAWWLCYISILQAIVRDSFQEDSNIDKKAITTTCVLPFLKWRPFATDLLPRLLTTLSALECVPAYFAALRAVVHPEAASGLSPTLLNESSTAALSFPESICTALLKYIQRIRAFH